MRRSRRATIRVPAALTGSASYAAFALLYLAGLLACGDSGPARATLSVAETLADADTAGYARATEPRAFRFPADHGPHPDFKHEWWYFTGNLETLGGPGAATDSVSADPREFGFQLTFFRSALRPDPVTVQSSWATRQAYMGHFALTDMTGEAFHAFERFDRGALGLAGAEGAPLRVWIGNWAAEAADAAEAAEAAEAADAADAADAAEAPGRARSPGRAGFRIRATEGSVGVDLLLRQTQPIVLQGEDGLSRKGSEPGNASYYYSLMRLDAQGAVSVEGVEYRVAGTAWLDREWSTSALSPGVVGWDWFSLQLGDGSELMLYRLREADGGTARFSAGTFVDPDGTVTRLRAEDFQLQATGTWSSPRGSRYPSGWRVRIRSLQFDLAVEPRLRDQELDLAFRYWEGAVAVEGKRAGEAVEGKGYVELTGY